MKAWSISARAALLAVSAPLLVRLAPATLARVIERLARPRGRRADVAVAVERGLELAARVVPLTCLTRAITRYVFLRRAGQDVTLRFGIGRQGEAYAGHSWVELDGEPYAESRDPRPEFLEMIRVPA